MVDDVFKASAEFFAQSDEVKRRSAATWEWYRGFVPPKEVGEDGRKGGLNQVYRLMLDLPADDPDVVAKKPLHLPNRWPEHMPGWKEAVGGYYDRLVGLQPRAARGLRDGARSATRLVPRTSSSGPWHSSACSITHLYRPMRPWS